MKDETTESKIERTRYVRVCQHCGKGIKGTSRKQLNHTFAMHQMFCKIKKEVTKDETTNTTN